NHKKMSNKLKLNNRRNFIKKGITGIAGLSVLPTLNSSSNNQDNSQINQGEMIYRTLGRTGIKVPVVSMGVMNANLPGLVLRSYENGIRLFDTAWFYQNGMNETMVGEVMKKNNLRDKSIISTKIFLKETERDLSLPETKQLFLDRFDQSLERLQTNYVDILLYHSSNVPEEHNSQHIIDAFDELKAAGKIKHTGVSLHGDGPALLDDIAEKGYYDVVMVMFNAAMAKYERLIKSIENAANKGIGIIAMKTQCGGGGYQWKEIYKDTEHTEAELNHKALLKWVLQHEFIPTAIPGYTTYEHLDENVSVAYDLKYSADEKAFLENAEILLASNFCIRCGQCKPTCPMKSDIPNLMRTYMYAYQYRNMDHALATEKTIKRSESINNCFECDVCIAECSREIQIAHRIQSLKKLNFFSA
ncbi:aldo/keto reductase, partial [Bacteroidota bacterium]